MHTHQFFTWTTHTAETTTLLDYKKLYTYVQHCNRTCNRILLVQYSIVYVYLINSRLDVTHSVHHHFHIRNFIIHPRFCFPICTAAFLYRQYIKSVNSSDWLI